MILLLTLTSGILFGILISSPMVIQDVDNLSGPKSSAGEITIVTPENKTYVEPMSGYYPGSIGFEDDIIGTIPDDWWYHVPDSGSFYRVVDEWQGRKNVYEIRKNGGTQKVSTSVNFSSAAIVGSVDFFLYKDTNSSIDASRINLEDGFETDYFTFGFDGGTLYTGTWQNKQQIFPNAFSKNEWHYVRVDFNLSLGWQVQIDDIVYGAGYAFSTFVGTPIQVMNFQIESIWSGDNPNYGTWVDSIGYSWDPNYNIGDNKQEGLLLGFNSTNLDWMEYSLDEQPNYTIHGNYTVKMPNNGLHKIQVFGNNTSGTCYESNVRYFTVDRSQSIHIQNPEAKTYTAPDSGYYPATYGFESVIDGSFPSFLINIGTYPISVVSSRNGHNKVLWFDDNGYSYSAGCSNSFTNNIDSGTIEFWFLIDDAYDRTGMQLGSGNNAVNHLIRMGSRYDLWRYEDSVTVDLVIQRATGGNMPGPLDNTWHHIRIDFECTNGNYMGLSQYMWKCWIDGIESTEMEFYSDQSFADNFRMGTSTAHTSYNMYIDAIGYSWSPDYNIGDNLYEGLILGYDSSVVLDWQGYSLDGQSNKTILGNKTILMPADGQHYIQVFGNDSIGNIYESDVRYFDVDIYPVDITIISPTSYELFQGVAPDFEIFIDDPDLNSTWYSLDGGVTDIPFAGFTGTIDQTEWNKGSNGTITIGFYANNSLNHISYKSVVVRKDVLGPLITVNSPQENDVVGFTAPDYDLSIEEYNLDSIWYSLDYGVSVFPIFSLTGTLDQPEWEKKGGGTVPIRFYANDSLGHDSFTDVSVIKDIINPLVTINSPGAEDVFGETSPDYDISITESNLETYWYTLDGGITNITISSLTGTIVQSEWEKSGNGTVNIKFFAEDEGGNEGFAEILVKKDINLPLIIINTPITDDLFGPQPPQYDLSVVEPNIDSMWYTLDNGVTTISFIELTGTIDQTEWNKFSDGIVIIKFYVKDKGDNEAFAEVSVTKDLIAPIITINEPVFAQVFVDISPYYSIFIDETSLDSYWYSLDGGQTNHSISELTGAIDQSAWDSLSDGHITLRFYAKDEAGNVGHSSVSITKRTTPGQTPPGIPGYDLYLLIGALSIISALLLRKRVKS